MTEQSFNIYELIAWFWAESEERSVTPTEAALYSFLLARANARRWQMPLRIATAAITMHINTSRQNVVKARASLKSHGFIDYTPGTNEHDATQYTILNHARQLSPQLSAQLSTELSPQLSPQLSHYNMKDKYNNNYIIAQEKSLKPLTELQQILLADQAWQASVIQALSSCHIRSPADLTEHITQFFRILEAKGSEDREVNECKSYFYNWINKNIKNSNNGKSTFISSQRRGTAVGATAAKDFEGKF